MTPAMNVGSIDRRMVVSKPLPPRLSGVNAGATRAVPGSDIFNLRWHFWLTALRVFSLLHRLAINGNADGRLSEPSI